MEHPPNLHCFDSDADATRCLLWHVVLPAEFEDLNGGCPNVTVPTGFASRPSYLLPLNPSKDPFSWYQRTLTFQVIRLSHISNSCLLQSCDITSRGLITDICYPQHPVQTQAGCKLCKQVVPNI